jgi:TRAP-type C4-dicarboxylate transport system substrate-binding protein
MAQAWQEASNGDIRVRIYAGGVAGDDSDMVRKMRIGQLHAATLTGQGLAQIEQNISVFQTPMLLRSDGELDYVRTRLGPQLADELSDSGFKLLNWTDVGWVYLYSKAPARHPDDVRPMKLWVWAGDAVWADTLRDSGFNPVPLPATDIHMGLQSGLIDAFTAPPAVALSYQWFAQAPHLMKMKWAPLTGAVVISNKAWKKIPDDLKPEFERIARTVSDAAQAEIRAFEDEAIVTMKGYGLTVNEITAEDEADWQALANIGYKSLVGRSIPEPIFNEVMKLRNEYRETLVDE